MENERISAENFTDKISKDFFMALRLLLPTLITHGTSALHFSPGKS